ncbi:DUF3310 domain-containing protein [Streptomyces sp. NPDC046853]|uniref:DUF3310 domain-containing protein n=1 Tax=Streptomyces sp. NPDC046853 TaxID=3154920 RepID=UPI0033FD9D38
MTFEIGDRVVIAAPATPYAQSLKGQAGKVSGIALGPYPVEVTLDTGRILGFAEHELILQASVEVWLKALEKDDINHPAHYTWLPNGLEVIDITEHMNFSLGNVVKYVLRAGHKTDDPVTDLRKAAWYIEREISRLEGAL